MESGTLSHMLKWFKGPHPTWQSKKSRNQVCLFLQNEEIGIRIFGWLAIPISWLDMLLEKNPMAWRAASGYSVVAVKPSRVDAR